MSAPQLTYISPFLVAGNTVRTCNRDEMNPETAQIAPLWRRFLKEGIAVSIHHMQTDTAAFGIYSHYESDASGFYNLTVGRCVSMPPTSPAVTAIQIEGGNYLVFKAVDALPENVFKAWDEVWNYFEQNQTVKRKFSTDFEKYQDNTAAIYIAVE